jgi:hypothetical protein
LTLAPYFAIDCGMQPSDKEAARARNTEPLRAWAEAFGKGATTHLARRSGLTFAACARLIKGQAQPKPYTATLIERATDGAVKAADLLGVTSAMVVTNDGAATPGHAESAA